MSEKDNDNVGNLMTDVHDEYTAAAKLIQDGIDRRAHAKANPAGEPDFDALQASLNVNRDYGSLKGGAPLIDFSKPIQASFVERLTDLSLNRHYDETVTSTVYTRHLIINIYKQLVDAAQKRQTLIYETIALSHGLPVRGSQLGQVIAPLLERIYLYCVDRGLPHLTSIVVRKSGDEKGLPGNGFWKLLHQENPCYATPATFVDPKYVDQETGQYNIAGKRKITADLQKVVFDFYSLEDI